jgi:hypothetical protein
MKKSLFRKTLVFGIIMLFLGMGVIPKIVKEVSANYEEGLVAYWNFDEGNASIAYDSSGNNNHGVLYGPSWTTGISGSALELDGVNDYASVPDSSSLDITDNITIEAWVYPYSMSWVAPLISKGTNSSNYGYYLATGQYYADGCGSFKLHSNGTKTLWLYSSQPLTTGQWNHVVGVRAGTSASIYINGMISDAGICFAGPIQTNDLSVEFGTHSDYSVFFHGILDEVRIYNRALTAHEIYNRYTDISSAYIKNGEPTDTDPINGTPGFDLVIVIVSIVIVMGLSWKHRRLLL